MTRHRKRPTRCDLHDRVVYRNRDQAIGAVIALYDSVPDARLAVYVCEETGDWHVTTSSFKAAAWREAG